MTQAPALSATTPSLRYWDAVWQSHRRRSYLQQTQHTNPERWAIFYEQVADIWDDIAGLSARPAGAIARWLVARRLIAPGDSVLDLGCGPGTLALAMANRGFRVTAVDSSAAMIAALNQKKRRARAHGIQAMVLDWKALPLQPNHNWALGCFFPDAFSPEGLGRMETIAADGCLLLAGDGREAFPLRKKIWEMVMDVPTPRSYIQVVYAGKYLRSAGRKPALFHLSVPVRLDVDAERCERFYREYFAIFDKHGKRLQQAIADCLAPYKNRNRVQVSGVLHLTALWWKPQHKQAPALPMGT